MGSSDSPVKSLEISAAGGVLVVSLVGVVCALLICTKAIEQNEIVSRLLRIMFMVFSVFGSVFLYSATE